MSRYALGLWIIWIGACGGDEPPMADASPPAEDAWVDPTVDAGPPPDYGLDAIDRTPDPSCEETWMVAAQIRVLDESGRGAPGVRTQICVQHTGPERLTCGEPTETWVDGTVTLIIPEGARCVRRAGVQYGGHRGDVITGYCALELEPVEAVVSAPGGYTLYETYPPEDLPPEGDPNMMRTVTFEDGLEVDIIPAELEGDYSALRGRRIPLDRPPCFAEGLSMPLLGVWAFSPELAVTIPEEEENGGFVTRFPNVGGLSAGTFAQALYLEGFAASMADPRIPVVSLRLMGEGVSGGTGGLIDGGDEMTLPRFTWAAYREKPFRVDP